MKNLSFPGDELRVRREALKLSIDDVYRKLHIPADFVQAVEDGNVAALPPMCYSVGFLRTYCILLEVEPEKYADILKDCVRPAPGFLGIQKGEDERTRPRWLNDFLAWGTICAILVLGWVTYSVTFQPKSERGDKQVEAMSVEAEPDSGSE